MAEMCRTCGAVFEGDSRDPAGECDDCFERRNWPTTEREQIFDDLKVIVHARKLVRSVGATINTPHVRSVVDEHLAAIEVRLRERCRPQIA